MDPKQLFYMNMEPKSPYTHISEMLDNSVVNCNYDKTIGESKEKSVSQAIAIMKREMKIAEQQMRKSIVRPKVNWVKGVVLAICGGKSKIYLGLTRIFSQNMTKLLTRLLHVLYIIVGIYMILITDFGNVVEKCLGICEYLKERG